MTRTQESQRRQRGIALVMGLEAATLAIMALLHLTGSVVGSSVDAGVAEAVICVVLMYGAARLMRDAPRARGVANASIAFAIVGFAIGLGETVRGADALDVAYHVTMLPLLALTLRALVRRVPRDNTTPVNYLERSLT